MKMRICLVAFFASTFYFFAESAIMSSEVRTEKLDAIRSLVSASVIPVEDSLLSLAPSPFAHDRGIRDEEAEETEKVVLSDEDLLQAISASVNPTGIFMFGGEFYLIFKEKRLKDGSSIAVTYEGAEYNLQISEITGSSYRVRLGDAELQLKLK